MNIQPIADRLIVKRKETVEKSEGGIWFPEKSLQKQQEAVVISVGEGRLDEDGQLIPMSIKPGQKVLFGRYAGTEITNKGEKLLLIREEEVFAVLDDTGKKPKVFPMGDRVIVKRVNADEKVGVLFVPTEAQKPPNEAIVVGVGPGRRSRLGKILPMDIKAEQRILFQEHAGTEIKIQGVEHLLLSEHEILGVVE